MSSRIIGICRCRSKAHPVAFLRAALAAEKILRTQDLAVTPRNGPRVRVAGLVLVRQRPGTASGVIFLTIEDETGIANSSSGRRSSRLSSIVLGARLIAASGRLQSESGVIHVVMERIEDMTPLLGLLSGHGGSAEKSRLAPAPTRRGVRTRAIPRAAGEDSAEPLC